MKKIVRIDGHFHGVHDYALANNLAGKIDRNNPGDQPSRIGHLSAGIPASDPGYPLCYPLEPGGGLREPGQRTRTRDRGIIMNPIDYNNGCMTTTREYLQDIRHICDEYGIVFILDEILSGFRTGISCGQGYYGVTPDLCLLGKALTNGFPALCHRREGTHHGKDHRPSGPGDRWRHLLR